MKFFEMKRRIPTGMILGGVVLCAGFVSQSLAQVQSYTLTENQIEYQHVRSVELGDHVRVDRLELPDGMVSLELDRVNVLADDAEIIVGSVRGQEELPRPEVVLLSGIVAGDPASMAYLAISPYGVNGFVDLDGELISISTGPYAQGKELSDALRSARMSDLLEPNPLIEVCGYTPGDAALEPNGPAIEYGPRKDRGAVTCRIAGIAVETDWEFTDRLFAGNANASAAYIVSLMGAISEIYERDVNVRLSIPFLRVWSDDSDPYSPAAGDPLDLVRNEWNATMGDVDRTLVHYFTGRTDTSYGGVAYVSVLCNTSYGYGVSAYINGSFPYPLVDHNGGNWDVVVASHEIGHNFGTGHTHNYSPPIDGCGNGDCSLAYGGTIMSYCHTCSGGMTNLVLQFHPRVQDTIIGYMDSINCDLVGQGVSAADDAAETIEEVAVTIDALGNDESQSCDPFTLLSFDLFSAAGGTVDLLAGQGPGGRDLFEYTPPAGFGGLDSFGYTITANGASPSATVTVDVRALRDADTRINPIAGLSTKYYVLSSPSSMPDFDAMEPYAQDVTDHVSYPTTGGVFMSSGRADQVGALIEGYVWAFLDGVYTFTTDSDDGSRLWIGDELVVNNDGLHGMVKRGGTIPLHAGWHRLRIEFFENGGGAGLISTIAGPGLAEQDLQGFILSHESNEPCSVADLNGDGILDFFDISAFLQAFNAQDGVADFTNDGIWDFFDVSAFLQAFNAGCP
ncbi:MAG: M12 family metallo-peptidase [Phycisphaerales bacterium]